MPTPDSVAFSVFGIEIMWYGILVTCGIIVAALIVYLRAPKHEIDRDRLLTFMIICIPVGIVGARAYYVLFNWSYYAGDIGRILNMRAGGLAVHGGLIAGLVMAAILCFLWKIRPLNLMDLCVPAIALAQSIGRWGNYFNGEAHGGPTDLPWAVIIDGQTYHPTFLYESIWCFILFLILIGVDNHRKFEGQVLLLYGILYSCERFLVEALRTDSLMIGPFKQAQVISLVIIIVCTVCYIVLRKRSNKKTAPR